MTNFNKNLIKCLCIDSSHRPAEVKTSEWPVKDQEYTVIATCKAVITNELMFKLAEIEISNPAYWGYKASRFSFNVEDLEKLFEIEKDIDIEELMTEYVEIEN